MAYIHKAADDSCAKDAADADRSVLDATRLAEAASDTAALGGWETPPKKNCKHQSSHLLKPRSKKQNMHSALSTSPSGTCNLQVQQGSQWLAGWRARGVAF